MLLGAPILGDILGLSSRGTFVLGLHAMVIASLFNLGFFWWPIAYYLEGRVSVVGMARVVYACVFTLALWFVVPRWGFLGTSLVYGMLEALFIVGMVTLQLVLGIGRRTQYTVSETVRQK
jgi:hypothetical protein